MKNLAADFVSVENTPAAEAMDAEADEEFVRADDVPAQPHPPEASMGDFWSNRQMMLDRQRNGITSNLRGEMQVQEMRLGARIDEEKN